jgi:ABC-type methionine transport system permease subunit
MACAVVVIIALVEIIQAAGSKLSGRLMARR